MRRRKPSPPPRTAPLVAGAAIAGVLGCGPKPQPVPPQAHDPEPYNEMPIDAGPTTPDGARTMPPQVPPQREEGPPPDAPVLPDRVGPGDPYFTAPPPLVGPFDRGED